MSELGEKRDDLVRRRAVAVTRTVLTWAATGQILVASFAVGAALGPVPLRFNELFMLASTVLVASAFAAVPIARRRLGRAAILVLDVEEGRRHRRIVAFEDHLLLGDELVPLEAVERWDPEGSTFVLRYRDPDHDGSVLRELVAEPALLGPFAVYLAARLPTAPAPGAS